MTFHTRNGAVFAACVNLSQAAKKAHALGYTKDVAEAEEMFARVLGHRNFYEVRQLAKSAEPSRNIAHLDDSATYGLLHKKAVAPGESFPRHLPAKFNRSWKDQSLHLLDTALAKCERGVLDFVALVGAEGTGKTIVASAHCQKSGGNFIDADLYAWWAKSHQAGTTGPVNYLDRPAKNPSATGMTARRAAVDEWMATANDKRTESKAAEVFRVPEIGFPMDDLEELQSTSPARTLARSSPTVIAFPSVDAVQKALDHSWHATMSDPSKAALLNWGAAHVVCLDDMTTCTLRRQPK